MSIKQEQRLNEVVPYDFNWSMQFAQDKETVVKSMINFIELINREIT
jgi:hypothetical protein